MAALTLPVATIPAQSLHLASSKGLTQRSRALRPYGGRLSLNAQRARTWVAVRAADSTLGPNGDGNVKEITSRADWEAALSQAGDRLVVLDIATRTCGPCRFIYPKVVQMSLEYTDTVFLKIFGDLNEETRVLMREWGIRAVPNFRFYRNGVLVHSHGGAKEDDLRKNLEKFHSQSAVA